jgi:hypothetical protein
MKTVKISEERQHLISRYKNPKFNSLDDMHPEKSLPGYTNIACPIKSKYLVMPHKYPTQPSQNCKITQLFQFSTV